MTLPADPLGHECPDEQASMDQAYGWRAQQDSDARPDWDIWGLEALLRPYTLYHVPQAAFPRRSSHLLAWAAALCLGVCSSVYVFCIRHSNIHTCG